jgi:hypothetical protein
MTTLYSQPGLLPDFPAYVPAEPEPAMLTICPFCFSEKRNLSTLKNGHWYCHDCDTEFWYAGDDDQAAEVTP